MLISGTAGLRGDAADAGPALLPVVLATDHGSAKSDFNFKPQLENFNEKCASALNMKQAIVEP